MKKIKEYNYWDIDFKQEQLDKQIKDNFKYFEQKQMLDDIVKKIKKNAKAN